MKEVGPKTVPALVGDDFWMVLFQKPGGADEQSEGIPQFVGNCGKGSLYSCFRVFQKPCQVFVFCPEFLDFQEQFICAFLFIIHGFTVPFNNIPLL